MKLFQKLLIAPAALGLLAPLSANASEVTISDFATKENLAITNSRIDGLEARLNNFEAGSFSDTTTLSGEASFRIGALDESVITEAVTATYSYDLDLNSSFTGEDNLYVGIEAGNFVAGSFVTDNADTNSDNLTITSMYYSFPLGNFDVAVGPKLENDDLMPTTITKYSDKFFMGTSVLTGADLAAAPGIEGSGFAIGGSFDNGFNTSASVIGVEASAASGFLTTESFDAVTLSAGYDGDNFGIGFIYVDLDNACTLLDDAGFDGFTCADLGVARLDSSTSTLGAYWSPNDGKTTLSATYGIVSLDMPGQNIEDIAGIHFGVDHEVGPGVLSAAIKSQEFSSGAVVNGEVPSESLGSYGEIYYTYDVNDSLQIRSGVAFAMPDDEDEGIFFLDQTAVGAEATFKF